MLGSTQKLPGSLVVGVLMSQAASLRVLKLDVGAAAVSGADLAVLAALRALEELTIILPEFAATACWSDHGAGIFEALWRLPALTLLKYAVEDEGFAPVEALLTVSQLAALRSPSLKDLYCSMISTPVEWLVLGTLPALAACVLYWECLGESHVLHVTPTSFSATSGLTKLHLGPHQEVQLALHCFSGLSMLADLRLYDCQLTAVPAALSGVQHTLRRLELSCNNELQIDQAGFDTLLALSLLEKLDLGKNLAECPSSVSATLGYLPPLWSPVSFHFLVRFLSGWQTRRPTATLPEFSA